MTLPELRKRIDGIDSRIASLLSERMEISALVKRLKSAVEDRGREAQVLENVRASARGFLDSGFLVSLYRSIIEESKRVQGLGAPTVGFQGVHGANSEAAALSWMPDCAPMPSAEFEDVFSLVSGGLVDYGILPVENSSGGIVGPVNALLINTDLKIVGAVDMSISHCLVAPREIDHRDIRIVYSHPQALLQCREFIARNKLEPRPYPDTAGAARMIAESGLASSAAIASRLAAELYGLEIIKEDIQDVADNRTRFVVLAKDSVDGEAAKTEDGGKCSIVFMAEHSAGSLFRILEIFARESINLTRIESVPEKPGEYAMFMDFIGSRSDERVVRVLRDVASLNASLRFLGCYDERRVG